MFKQTLTKARNKFRCGFRRFAVFDLCAIAVAALFVLENHDVIREATQARASLGIFWGALAGVFVQLLCEWRAWPHRRLLVGLVTAAIGALGCWFCFALVEGTPSGRLWGMLYPGTCFSLVAASVAVLYRVADERTLVSRLTLNAFGVNAVAMVFVLSQMLCLLAFDRLVASVNPRLYGDVAGVSCLLILSVGFLSFLPGRERDDGASDRAAAFFFWLLLPAALILLGILYLYLGKIAWTRTMPSGELNWFGSVALAVYVFFWLALRDSSRPFFRLFVRWGWALLLPVLAAQVVGIVIRYRAYGLSTPRFAGMVTLSFGVFALALAALNRRPHVLFVFIAIAGIVFTVMPLNIIDVPIRNQEARLRAALARCGLLQGDALSLTPGVQIPADDAKVIVGSWRYLTDADSSWGWVLRHGGQEGLRPTVWYRPTFAVGLHKTVSSLCRARNVDDVSLPLLLGLDENRLDGKRDCADFGSMQFRLSREATVPIAEYARLMPLDSWRVRCEPRAGRWVAVLSGLGTNEDKEEFDVTDCVMRILDVGKCNGRVLGDRTFDLQPENAVWPLRTGMALIVSELRASGPIGERPASICLSCCAVVTNAEGE